MPAPTTNAVRGGPTLYVVYYRVSTKGQGESGLGLQAQEKEVLDFLNRQAGTTLSTFTEVESGRNCNRPQLEAALEECRLTGASLLIAKVDRLTRDLHFLTLILNGGVQVVCPQMPETSTPQGRFFWHIMGSVAELEAEMISQRTRDALRASGKPLGRANPNWGRGSTLTEQERTERLLRGSQKGSRISAKVRHEKSEAKKRVIRPIVQEMRDQGSTLEEIAEELNRRGVCTPSGKGSWSKSQISRVLT